MKKNKGITLIALIITIVVMLILVGVTVNVLINSNILGSAKNTAKKWQDEAQKEAENIVIDIDGKKYASIEDYLAGNTIVKSNIAGGTRVTENTEYTIEDETRTAMIPAGFTVSGISSERTIDRRISNLRYTRRNNSRLDKPR